MRINARSLSTATIFVSIALLAGCEHVSPFYQNPVSGPAKSIKVEKDYSLAFIEFGEMGSYQDISQLQKAAELVRNTRQPLVITYVHGWQNNAGSDDVRKFSKFLSEVAQTPLIRNKEFHVVGVYLGWRGKLTGVPIAKELTFYSRKAAAERLANNFDCFDAISSVAEAARRNRKGQEQYTILLGHSFGGLVVERAVAHAIDSQMHGRSHGRNSLPADLTLVLNPASDSILSRQIISALYQENAKNTRPLFISVTSTADAATGKIFPIGTSLSAVTKMFGKVSDPASPKTKESERDFYTSTPGHNKSLVNHTVWKESQPYQSPRANLSALEINLARILKPDEVVLPGAQGGFELWHVKQKGVIDVPYWDIQVDKSIIKDHGDIWNERAEALMAGLFSIANPIKIQRQRHEIELGQSRDFRRGAYKQDNTASPPPQ